jgi:hypothetical protein
VTGWLWGCWRGGKGRCSPVAERCPGGPGVLDVAVGSSGAQAPDEDFGGAVGGVEFPLPGQVREGLPGRGAGGLGLGAGGKEGRAGGVGEDLLSVVRDSRFHGGGEPDFLLAAGGAVSEVGEVGAGGLLVGGLEVDQGLAAGCGLLLVAVLGVPLAEGDQEEHAGTST